MQFTLAGLLLVEAAFLILWSSGFIGAKYGLPHAGTYTLLFYRYLLLSLVLLAYLACTRQLRFGDRRQVWRAAGMGVLGHAIWLAAAVDATQYGAAPGLVALVASTQPLITAALALPVLGERIGRWQWLGLILGLCGVVLVVGDQIHASAEVAWWAYCLPFLSALSLTAATVWQRRLEIDSRGFLPVMQNLSIQCWATAAVLLPFALALEGMAADFNRDFVFALAWLTFVVSLGGYGLLILLFKHCEASRVASLLYLVAPVVMVMDYFAFGAVITAHGYIGLLIAAVGVALVQRGGLQPKTPKQANCPP